VNADPSVPPDLTLSVVIPTRNEAHGVLALMQRVAPALDGVSHELIFVDDSDDGTESVLRELAFSEYPQIHVIHRSRGERAGGLSGAVIAGFDGSRGEYVAVMDADLQHPPELLTALVDKARERGADLVVASRYVGDGSAAGLADPTRRLVSRGTAIFARLLFCERILRVTDPASGFFLVRRSLLQGVVLRPIGYKILLEVLLRTRWRIFAEVPYRFSEREADTSKASLHQGVLFLQHCLRLVREVPTAGLVWKFSAAFVSGALLARLLRGGAGTDGDQ
jgi:dolichol-phosphate mannosyltransferase